MQDQPVGDLVRGRRGEIRFNRLAGAPSLTVAPEGAPPAWTPSFTRAWFDGLLPEESRRSVAEADHDVARGDTFGLLAVIGWECAGAVSVLPEGHEPAMGTYARLADEAVWGRLDALPRTLSEDAIADGRAEADRRYPAVPEGMRAAVDAQITRLVASPW